MNDQQVPDDVDVAVHIRVQVRERHQIHSVVDSHIDFYVTNNIANVLQSYVGTKVRKVYMDALNEWREKWLAANETTSTKEEDDLRSFL